MRVLLYEVIMRNRLVMSEIKYESEAEELNKKKLFQTTSEREYLELLADDNKWSLIAEKLSEIYEDDE